MVDVDETYRKPLLGDAVLHAPALTVTRVSPPHLAPYIQPPTYPTPHKHVCLSALRQVETAGKSGARAEWGSGGLAAVGGCCTEACFPHEPSAEHRGIGDGRRTGLNGQEGREKDKSGLPDGAHTAHKPAVHPRRERAADSYTAVVMGGWGAQTC